MIVVKVGGSLFDLPDLGERLRSHLECLETARVLLVPGGGATADVVRQWDRRYGLGEERAHWLALRAMALNAHFLTAMLPGSVIVSAPPPSGLAVLDAFLFAEEDEARSDPLPHRWEVTSDSVAARAALVFDAARLVLLKSVSAPGLSWDDAAARGFVDAHFPRLLQNAPRLRVEMVSLRAPG